MNYYIQHAESTAELYSVLDFSESIFGKSELLDRVIRELQIKSHPELIIYAEVNGQVRGEETKSSE